MRDANFSNDDKIEIILDTYRDRRNAFRFAVNPLGTQQDALITDEGRDVNLSWDAQWPSSGRIDQTGWTVEIAIPLTTLRFKEGEDTWGFNSARIIRRKNEENLWSSWQRSFGLERISQAGELVGVGEIKRRRLYDVKPYVTGGWRQGVPQVGAAGFDAGVQGKLGLEVAKVGITPSLTAKFGCAHCYHQCQAPLHLPPEQRFLHYLQSDDGSGTGTTVLQSPIKADTGFHLLNDELSESHFVALLSAYSWLKTLTVVSARNRVRCY